jgi:hypothetical protein
LTHLDRSFKPARIDFPWRITLRAIVRFLSLSAVSLVSLIVSSAHAADQTQPGAGNSAAGALAAASPLVSSGRRVLERQADRIHNASLRTATLDAITNPNTCIAHRAGLTDADKDAIVTQLTAAGFINGGEASSFPGGARAGVFPPVLDDGSRCPRLPQNFFSAPGSPAGGHHTYPGGLVVHESFNLQSNLSFANNYRRVFARSTIDGLPEIDGFFSRHDIEISEDLMIAAPLWHDWAKAIVLQWNADGTEFKELHIAGTGGHHILGVAETMKRGLPPDVVVAQAAAHNSDEGNVVTWLTAAAIIAQIDPVAKGYLRVDAQGKRRFPIVRALGSIDLNAAGKTNLLVEYTLHNLSDADWILAEPAVETAELFLKTLAADFGYDPSNIADYNTRYRNPALSYLSAERLLMLYGTSGLPAVRAEVQKLRARGIL